MLFRVCAFSIVMFHYSNPAWEWFNSSLGIEQKRSDSQYILSNAINNILILLIILLFYNKIVEYTVRLCSRSEGIEYNPFVLRSMF